jgi:hypothetical protein
MILFEQKISAKRQQAVESKEKSLVTVVSVAKKGETATSKRALGKINPNVDDDDSVFDDSGTSKKVTQKKARTLPQCIYKNGSGNFVSVMLFQIMLSDFMSCLTCWSFLFDNSSMVIIHSRDSIRTTSQLVLLRALKMPSKFLLP